jgi:WD40 repeat protein
MYFMDVDSTAWNEYVRSVTFSPDGRMLASGGGDVLKRPPVCELKLWDVASGKELGNLEGHQGMVFSVAFSRDGKVLASGGGNAYRKLGEVFLWDVVKRKKIESLSGHKNLVKAVAFSPDAKKLASGSADKSVKIWEIGKINGSGD